MYEIEFSKRAEKDLKLCSKRGYNKEDLKKVIAFLQETGTVPLTHRPHRLSGDYDGIWECHIKADWLLLWIVTDKTVTILRTGTHSDLF